VPHVFDLPPTLHSPRTPSQSHEGQYAASPDESYILLRRRYCHLPRAVFPEEKANYISWKATNYTNKQRSDQRPRIRLSSVKRATATHQRLLADFVFGLGLPMATDTAF